MINKPQNTKLFTNLLLVRSLFQSFKLLKALKEPKQLENNIEDAKVPQIIIFLMILIFRLSFEITKINISKNLLLINIYKKTPNCKQLGV